MTSTSSRASREAARRQRVEQLRREQRAKERRRTLVVIAGLAVVILVVVVLVAISLTRSSSSSADAQIVPSTPVGPATTQRTPARVANPTNIKGVLAWDTKGYPAPGKADSGTLAHTHVTGPVKYAVLPPVGGEHSPIWMNAGVYTQPVPPERAVHNLEHGAVWITYRPDLPSQDVDALTAFVGRQSLISEAAATRTPGQANRYVDLSPWSSNDLPAPIVISSWGYQLRVQSPNDPRLQQFVDTFRHSKTYTPEYGSPVDGVPIQTGGRAAEDGGTKPNPAGVASGQ